MSKKMDLFPNRWLIENLYSITMIRFNSTLGPL